MAPLLDLCHVLLPFGLSEYAKLLDDANQGKPAAQNICHKGGGFTLLKHKQWVVEVTRDLCQLFPQLNLLSWRQASPSFSLLVERLCQLAVSLGQLVRVSDEISNGLTNTTLPCCLLHFLTQISRCLMWLAPSTGPASQSTLRTQCGERQSAPCCSLGTPCKLPET